MILFDIMEPTNIQKFNTVVYHKTKAINKEEFSKDLVRELNSQGTNIISVKDKITYYNEDIMKVLNKHAPLHKKEYQITRPFCGTMKTSQKLLAKDVG